MPDPQGGSTHKKVVAKNVETTDNALAGFITRPQFALKSA